MMICDGGGPVNLLTKLKAWHTHNIIRIGVVLPSYTDRPVG
jgi:hypothetical protein